MTKKTKYVLFILFSFFVVLIIGLLYLGYTSSKKFKAVDHYPQLLFCERLKIGMQRNDVELVLSEFGEYSYYETTDFSKNVIVSVRFIGSEALSYTFHTIKLRFDSSADNAKLLDYWRMTNIWEDPLDLPECDE